MDKPSPKERLEHMLKAIQLIRQFVEGVDEAVFLSDEIEHDGIVTHRDDYKACEDSM